MTICTWSWSLRWKCFKILTKIKHLLPIQLFINFKYVWVFALYLSLYPVEYCSVKFHVAVRRNTRYKSPQLVAQHCFVASFGHSFSFFTLLESTWPATKTFVACWRNAARWFVDLLEREHICCATSCKFDEKRATKSQNLLLKVDPHSNFRNNFFQPTPNVFVARQVYHAR